MTAYQMDTDAGTWIVLVPDESAHKNLVEHFGEIRRPWDSLVPIELKDALVFVDPADESEEFGCKFYEI